MVDGGPLDAAAVGTLIGLGYMMMLAASPAVAERIDQSRDIFILKQFFPGPRRRRSWSACRCCRRAGVRRLALAGCLVALALTALTLVTGVEIKGARRWIALPRHVGAA